MLKKLGADTWFLLGDRDLATHIRRTELLRNGVTLTEVADQVRRALGVATRVLPMCDQPVGTFIRTPDGLIHFEHSRVGRRAQDQGRGVHFDGAEWSRPAAGVLEAIRDADTILIA